MFIWQQSDMLAKPVPFARRKRAPTQAKVRQLVVLDESGVA